MNKIIAMGRITHDLELKTTPNGIPVLKFQIAVDRNYQRSGEEKKTDFFNVCAWRTTAEFIYRWFGKGRMILIDGEMQTSDYTDKNGNKVTRYEISADAAYFTGEKKDDNTVAQGYTASAGSYQQSPQNYQSAQAPTQPAPNYQAQYGAPTTTQNYQQAADMAAIAAKYAGAAPGTTAATPPPAPAVPAQQAAPPRNAANDTYPF